MVAHQTQQLTSTILWKKWRTEQSKVIGSMKPEISWKILRNLIEKLRAKFPASTCGYSMAKIAHASH